MRVVSLVTLVTVTGLTVLTLLLTGHNIAAGVFVFLTVVATVTVAIDVFVDALSFVTLLHWRLLLLSVFLPVSLRASRRWTPWFPLYSGQLGNCSSKAQSQ